MCGRTPPRRSAEPAPMRGRPFQRWRFYCRQQRPGPKDTAEALGRIGPDAKPVLPELVASLRDKEFAVRTHSAYALSKIGVEPKAAIPVWVELLKDSSEHLRVRRTPWAQWDRTPALRRQP